MSRSKDFRRHHRARLRRKRLRYYSVARVAENGNPRHLGSMLACVKACSCEMCGNPRRHFGLVTHQERLVGQIEAEELTDWLAIAEPAFDFWDNEVDDAYNER